MARFIPAFLVAGGNLLLIVGLFAPWLRLSSSFGDTPGEHSYGPWSLLSQATSAALPLLLSVFIALAALMLSSVASLVIRPRRWQVGCAFVAVFLAMVGLAVTLLFLAGADSSLSLMWPYYTIQGLEYGAVAAIAGFICLALNALDIIIIHAQETPPQAASQ